MLSPSLVPVPAQRTFDRILTLAIAVIAILTTYSSYRGLANYAFEDSFITYRYANNVAAGHGYVFNLDERVFGATSPLYTGLLALCAFFGADVATCANWVSALGLGAIIVLGAALLRPLGGPLAALVFACAMALGAVRMHWAWGMETFLLVPLVLGTCWAMLRSKDALAGVLVGLAFLTRYDSALLAIALFAVMAWRQRRVPWKAGGIALAIVLPWLCFTQLYFGSVLPNTLGAKMGDTRPFEYFMRSIKSQMACIWRPPVENDTPIFAEKPLDRWIGSVLLGLALVGSIRALWCDRRALLLVLYPLVLVLGYSLIGPPIVFSWYLFPASVLFVLLAALGLGVCLPAKFQRCVALPLASVCTLALALFLPGHWTEQAAELTTDDNYIGRIGAYDVFVEWIRNNGLEREVLLTPEPGYLTYSNGNPVIDAAGLVSPGIHYHGNADQRTSIFDLARKHQPGLIAAAIPSQFPGYVAVVNAFPNRMLWLREDLHEQSLDRIAANWPGTRGKEATLHHPFTLDVKAGDASAWLAAGGRLGKPGIARAPLTRAGKALQEEVLLIQRGYTGSDSPPFLIDFDQLSFDLAATHSKGTLVQLLVDNKVLFEQSGHGLPAPGPGRSMPFLRQYWPVGLWRGQTAQIRILHAGYPNHYVAIDHLTSQLWERPLVLDDFERGGSFGGFWETTFPGEIADLKAISAKRGLEFAYSKGAALSLGLAGEMRMRSQPFRIERACLGFLFFDYGVPAAMHAELLIDGQFVRRYVCQQNRRIVPVTWDVREFLGREAVFHVLDRQPDPELWTGVDELTQFDEATPPL